MKRLLYVAPVLLLTPAILGAGFWGPVILLVGLIFFHELGHFLVAKWMGMPVEVFSLGFGPRLVGFQWKETDVRLSMLPLGGYVRLAGYNPEEPEAADPHGFLQQPTWKRLAFYSGGILANVLITVGILFYVGVSQANIVAVKPLSSPLLVVDVSKGLAADEAGIRPGDEIQSFGELNFPGSLDSEAVTYIQAHPGLAIPVTLKREGRLQTLSVTPRIAGGKGRLGVAFQPTSVLLERRAFLAKDLLTAGRFSVLASGELGWEILANFGKLATGKLNAKELSGPIGIVRMSSQAAKEGLLQFLKLVALISMNLAVLNALPIPFLDGGHAAILLIERLRGKDLSLQVKERILTGGFFLLATLIVLVFVMDILKLRH